MLFSIFDLFSQPFLFNTGNYSIKRGTCIGAIISFGVFLVTFSYLIYILQQYGSNQIDPVFRSQSLISHDLTETPLNSDLIGFRYEPDSSYILSPNKTYLVYLAFLQYSTPSVNQFIPLNVVDCTNPNLQGFKCIDFSNVQNYTLFLNTNQNSRSNVQIMTYGCRDLDKLKTIVPQNCADQTEIDKLINGLNSLLRLKLYTSQFNTASQKIEVNYRNAYVYTVANQQILTQLKTQNQNTSVKQGMIIQQQSQFSSPIQYIQQDSGLDKQYALQNIEAGAYSIVILMMDEIIQHIQIQYPTLPQILAMVSGIFTLLMFLGIVGKKVSQNSIQKDFFILFLKNIYQDSYLQILKKNNFYPQKEEIEVLNSEQYKYEEKATNDSVEIKDEKQKKTIKSNPVPAFSSKRKVSLEKFVNNYIQTQNTEQGSPTNLQVLNALQTAQCLNLQNFNDIASENLSLQKNITSYTEENTQASKINQQQLSNMQGDAISNWASQKIIQKKSNFNNKNEAFNQKYQRDILSERKHANIINNLKAIQDLECSQKILSDIRKIKKQMKEQKGFELQKVQYQIRKDMNIFNFVKDIILIKKAIMMILTKDQLAAINLVGCSSNFLEKNLNNISCNLDQFEFEQNLSHYEMQQTILQKEEFQNRFIETFLSRCSNESNISEIDTRIISSIKACHLN